MRQAVFVVVLVAAAFLGGAAVNGPAFRWAQAQVFEYLGLKDGGEIASVTLEGPNASTKGGEGSGSSERIGEPKAPATNPKSAPGTSSQSGVSQSQKSPAAGSQRDAKPGGSESAGSDPNPKPSVGNVLGVLLGLKTEAKSAASPRGSETVPEPPAPEPSETEASGEARPPLARRQGRTSGSGTAKGSSASASASASASPSTPPPLQAPAVGEPPADPSRTASASGTGPDSGAGPAPLDPSVAPAFLASLSPTPAAETPPLEQAPSPTASATAVATSHPQAQTPPGDWGELRRKMRAVGVTRYTIEGEPGGRVVFACLIPLAGRQAVSQRFEAEGDDEFQAAQTALRRITLWRAAQNLSAPSPSPSPAR